MIDEATCLALQEELDKALDGDNMCQWPTVQVCHLRLCSHSHQVQQISPSWLVRRPGCGSLPTIRHHACHAPRMGQWQKQQFQKVCLHQGSRRSTEKTQTDEEWTVGHPRSYSKQQIGGTWRLFTTAWKQCMVPELKQCSLPVCSRDGSSLITDRQGTLSRWAEHFHSVLNQTSTFDSSVLNLILNWAANMDLIQPPNVDEFVEPWIRYR